MKTDSEIKRDVTNELAWDTRIDEAAIGVAVHHGVVTLTGTVSSWSEKHTVEEAAYRVAGVRDLANEIEIKPSWATKSTDAEIAEAARVALEWNRFVPDQQIRLTVTDAGMVTLIGTVDTLAERDEAERVVRRLAGVHGVINQLAIAAPKLEAGAIQTTILQALARRAAREANDVTVRVDGDTVVLTGQVGSWSERRAVVGAALGTPGVHRVDDRLDVA